MGVELQPAAEAKLAALCAVTNRTASQLASEAVERLHRSLIGLPVEHEEAPKLETGPFRKRYSYNPAEILLRQSDETDFTLEEPFRVIDDAGADRWIVDGDVSDLASVPSFLTWLVPRYGKHTFAALLHDHLQDPNVDNAVSSAQADEVFRDAMADTGVPLLVRWLMWAAVSARTRVKARGLGRYAAVGWVGSYVLLGAIGFPTALLLFVAGVLSFGQWLLVTAVALGSPFVLALVWRRDYRFAVLTGVTGQVIALPSLLDFAVAKVLEVLDRRHRRKQLALRS